VLGRELAKGTEKWRKQPLAISVAELRHEQAGPEAQAAQAVAVQSAMERRSVDDWRSRDPEAVDEVDATDLPLVGP
jgi:hypothetical protein